MKYGLTLLSIALFLGQFNAQTIINGDFESWVEEEQYQTVNGWDNSNEEFGGLEITLEVTNTGAFEGDHAVSMENIALGDEVLFGFVLNGVFGDDGPESGFPYSGTIDGMSAQIQYDVQPMDTAIALLVGFYEGSIVDMQVAKITGTATDWVELNVDFTGATVVDEVAVAFASTNAIEDEFVAVPGSSLLVDDVKLTFEGNDIDVVPNGSFEDWEIVSQELLQDWNYFSHPDYSLIEKTIDAYAGDYAVKLENHYDDDEPIQSILTNGEISFDGIEGGQDISDRPDTFIGRYKYESVDSDTAFVSALFYLEGEAIGYAVAIINPADEYAMFDETIQYSSSATPDQVLITATPGEHAGSILILDNFSFDFALSVGEELSTKNIDFSLYPNPIEDIVSINLEGEFNTVEALSVYDITGKMVLGFAPSAFDQSTMEVDLSSMKAGTYMFVLTTDNGSVTKRIIKK